MEFKGTTEKWEVGGTENELILTRKGAYRPNAMQVSCSGEIELKANALLISKSPEMLAMLQKIMKTYDKGTQTYLDCQKLIKEATQI
jgi:hypothetical protein